MCFDQVYPYTFPSNVFPYSPQLPLPTSCSVFFNSLSPSNPDSMCMGMGSSAGVWATYNGYGSLLFTHILAFVVLSFFFFKSYHAYWSQMKSQHGFNLCFWWLRIFHSYMNFFNPTSFFFFFKKQTNKIYFYFMCAGVLLTCILLHQKKGRGRVCVPWNYCDPSHGWDWELNTSSLKEQPVLLTIETFL